MKKLLLALLSLALLLGLSACGTKDDSANTPSTKGEALVELFKSLDTSASLEDIASQISEKQNTGVDLNMIMPVETGWLNGFSSDVLGFDEGYVVSPMMSQPYIVYLFKTADSKALIAELEEKHDLRWNICTSADEMVTAEKDGIVFFAMVNNSEE